MGVGGWPSGLKRTLKAHGASYRLGSISAREDPNMRKFVRSIAEGWCGFHWELLTDGLYLIYCHHLLALFQTNK